MLQLLLLVLQFLKLWNQVIYVGPFFLLDQCLQSNKLSFSTVFTMSHKLWYVFSLVWFQSFVISSLSYWLYSSELFNFHMLELVLCFCLWLISVFSVLRFEKLYGNVFIFFILWSVFCAPNVVYLGEFLLYIEVEVSKLQLPISANVCFSSLLAVSIFLIVFYC